MPDILQESPIALATQTLPQFPGRRPDSATAVRTLELPEQREDRRNGSREQAGTRPRAFR